MIKVEFFTFSPIQENTYLLSNDNGSAIIIDPGCYFSAEEETLKNHITHRGLKPKLLLNTHCHLDHVFGNKWVANTYGLELHIHPQEEQMLQLAPVSGVKWGLTFDNYSGPLHFIHHGDVIHLDNDELQVILAPGHSPGSVCFYNKAQGFVIGGDVLFKGSIGRTDLPFGNHAQLLQSIEEQLFVLPDETIIYPGHGAATTIGEEKKNNPFFHK